MLHGFKDPANVVLVSNLTTLPALLCRAGQQRDHSPRSVVCGGFSYQASYSIQIPYSIVNVVATDEAMRTNREQAFTKGQGGNLHSEKGVNTVELCAHECTQRRDCMAFNYNSKAGMLYIHVPYIYKYINIYIYIYI